MVLDKLEIYEALVESGMPPPSAKRVSDAIEGDSRDLARQSEMNLRFVEVDRRFEDLERRIDDRFADLERRTDDRFADLGRQIEETNRRIDDKYADLGHRIDETNRRIEETNRRIDDRADALDRNLTLTRWFVGGGFAIVMTLLGVILAKLF